ncbi:MAG TPA: PAS domain S-box protein [Bacteroidales bacterium]|mgnify:CR=1 FL=1|nr:PAS domain S-box protein [Bacteroidales bacterium]
MGNEKIKILAIDDHPDNLLILKAMIRDAFPNAVTMTALSGRSGIELAVMEDPDIVLLDVVMPEMDGFEVCKKLKSDNRTREIPVVFITAQKGDKENRIRAMEVGADAFLAKPVDENELIAQIRAMVRIKQANIERRTEKERLARLVEEQTVEQRRTYIATLNLLEDLNRENEARKKNEMALKSSEASLADIFQTVTEGIAYTTLTGEVLSVNSSLVRILGIPAERIIGKNILVVARELLNFNNLRQVAPILKKIITGKPVGTFQVEYQEKILEITASINKQSSRMTGVIRDITQRKRDEEALVRSEKRFRSLVENAFDGIYLTNGKYFYFVNEKYCEITGYSEQELTSPGFDFKVTLTDESQKLIQERNRLRSQNKTIADTYEMSILAKDGTLKIVEVSTVNLGHSKELSVMGIVRDITERKNMETQAIQSERLSALGEMSAGMAHEINQPLNTLSILFDNLMLEAKTNGSVSIEYLQKKSEKIFDNIVRMRNLIDHVRDFSRSQDGYILNLFHINNSIRNALTMVSEQFRIRGIELILQLDDTLPQIKGNIYKFEQVMLNLISNARDAVMDKKSLAGKDYSMSVSIKTSHDRQNIYVVVEDNGVGIKKDIIDKIMQPFYTTKDPGKGTGLGLSISYGIIKELEGKIELASEPMKWTRVTVTIPVKK